MRKNMAIKTAVFAASAALLISFPKQTAHAEEGSIPLEQGIAGIATSLEQISAADNSTNEKFVNILNTEVVSPYADTGVSKADDYVNIRKKASIDSDVVGKLYRGCAVDILERLDGDWVKIKSGDVEGYIASQFLATGDEAEKMADDYATKTATVVNTKTLRVRAKMNTDSTTLELIPEGEKYIVTKEYDDWAEILLGADDNGGDFTGYVSKDYVKIDVKFKQAISIEEENRILAEKEAKEKEAERIRQQAEDEKRKQAQAEAERKAAEAAAENNNDSSSSSSSHSSDDASSARSEIVNYALQFVGNSYVWGGTSLTNGADCSGFVWKIYQNFGYSIPRVSSDQAANAGKSVSLSDRRPGDLLFYGDSYGNVNHVAMYIGNDQIVQAANSRQGIIVSKYNYRNILKVRRIIY